MSTGQEPTSASGALEIPGDVDVSTGDVEATSDVVIAGTVKASRRVRSTGSVTVKGNVDAGTVEAAGAVHIYGGVTTQGKVKAGGGIHTRFCDDAELTAGGDVVVSSGVTNSRIQTLGKLLVESGALVGGKAHAREGAVVKMLGNENQLKTQLAIGLQPEVLAENRQYLRTAKKQREASARIREMVQPLLAQLKRLNPQQRERATELMYEADTLDAKVEEQARHQAAVMATSTPSGTSEVLVTEQVFPGVSIVFSDKMTGILQAHKGPVKFFRKLVGRVEEILMEEIATHVTSTLVSHEYVPAPAAESKS